MGGGVANSASLSGFATCEKKSAFTLAEVLITLGIIGIVAAMTLPTLLGRYKEKETVTRLKKTYSILSQAMLFAVEEYGTVDTWGISPSSIGKDEDNKTKLDTTSMITIADRLAMYTKHTRLAQDWGEGIVETNMQRTPLKNNYAQFDRPAAFALPDGTIVMIGLVWNKSQCEKSTVNPLNICSAIVVYFPDMSKKRIEGVNQFSFYMMKDRIIPFGVPEDTYNPFDRYCDISNEIRQSGRGCTAWVLSKENMNYLHTKRS